MSEDEKNALTFGSRAMMGSQAAAVASGLHFVGTQIRYAADKRAAAEELRAAKYRDLAREIANMIISGIGRSRWHSSA